MRCAPTSPTGVLATNASTAKKTGNYDGLTNYHSNGVRFGAQSWLNRHDGTPISDPTEENAWRRLLHRNISSMNRFPKEPDQSCRYHADTIAAANYNACSTRYNAGMSSRFGQNACASAIQHSDAQASLNWARPPSSKPSSSTHVKTNLSTKPHAPF